MKIKSFIKWAGGKNSILEKILECFPEEIENYYEPFLGGGSVFFNSINRAKKVFLSDVNEELILTYKVIKDNVDKLIELLKEHKINHNEDYYYAVRSMHKLKDHTEIAARFIYLNKTCYNGLYRVNKHNEFNVPFGRYKNPNIVNEDNLRVCSEKLKNVNLEMNSFENIRVCNNSLIYSDPPYDDAYNQYTSAKFNKEMQEKLREKCIEWNKNGAKVIISNADTEYIRGLYKGERFFIKEVEAPRYISCKNNSRRFVKDLIILLK